MELGEGIYYYIINFTVSDFISPVRRHKEILKSKPETVTSDWWNVRTVYN